MEIRSGIEMITKAGFQGWLCACALHMLDSTIVCSKSRYTFSMTLTVSFSSSKGNSYLAGCKYANVCLIHAMRTSACLSCLCVRGLDKMIVRINRVSINRIFPETWLPTGECWCNQHQETRSDTHGLYSQRLIVPSNVGIDWS